MINLFHNYAMELPVEFPQAAFKSAYYSFIIGSMLSRSFKVGLHSAMLAVTASIIGSLSLPILNRWRGQRDQISWGIATTAELTGLGLIQVLLRASNGHQINLFASAFFTLLALDLSMSSRGFNGKKRGPVFIIA